MSKRKSIDDFPSRSCKSVRQSDSVKKHSLDSDEEDEQEDNNVLHEDDIEGEEDGISRQEGDIKMTAFNMQEEMELGHFDKQGHFIWSNEKEVRDNWLDNIEWEQIKPKKNVSNSETQGLGEESDSENEEEINEIDMYKKIFTYLQPKESINKALRRLGGNNSKLSSVERLRLKKAGLLNNNKDVTDLTELANKLLTKTGNMDIYQETYENIKNIISKHESKLKAPTLDMYADDFEISEQNKLKTLESSSEGTSKDANELMWFLKWDQSKDEVEGPFDTKQMHKWSQEGYFKTGVWVRKNSEDTNYYSSNRIDFELYL